MKIEREFEYIEKYVDDVYNIVINKYLESQELDNDIDIIVDKINDITYDVCFDYISYDDLAENILKDNLSDFAYYFSNSCLDFTVIEIVDYTRRYCNMYIRDLTLDKFSDVLLSKLEYAIDDFYKKVSSIKLKYGINDIKTAHIYSYDSEEINFLLNEKENYRKMVENILRN